MNFAGRPNADRAFLRRVAELRESEMEERIRTASGSEIPVWQNGETVPLEECRKYVSNFPDADRDAVIRRLHDDRLTDAEIAERVGMTPFGVHSARKRLGLATWPRQSCRPVLRGAAHAKSKLTEEDVREMRRLHADGVRQVELARRFGVAQGVVSDIVNRRKWRRVA